MLNVKYKYNYLENITNAFEQLQNYLGWYTFFNDYHNKFFIAAISFLY